MSRSFKVLSPGESKNSWYWAVHASDGVVVARGVADSRAGAVEQANLAKKAQEPQPERASA